MKKFSTVVVGGGASGMAAAISAARMGRDTVICERSSRLGRKVLASGNGRCNFLNEDLDERFYNESARPFVKRVLGRFGKDDIKKFFRGLGLESCSEEGRLFPVTNQSASVLKVLEMELRRLGVRIETEFEVKGIRKSAGGMEALSGAGNTVSGRSVILAGGGRAYPALGSDGNAYRLAHNFGHRIIPPVPSAVPIVTKDPMCQSLQGQRIRAKVTAMICGKPRSEASGDLLFTKYGLSGTAILDISGDISDAINRRGEKEVIVSADLVPFMSHKELSAEIARRIDRGVTAEEVIIGILPNKFAPALKSALRDDAPKTALALKNRCFKVTGTRGWNEADFTDGGISTDEVDAETLESKLQGGLFFAGEILDITGRRGGYNLAWAWASGFVAGMSGH